jgi:hypothetical protein
MNITIVLLSVLLLSACTENKTLSNDEVIKAVKDCRKEPGFKADVVRNAFTLRVMYVVCVPKDEK